jgi:hypothetical protein
MKIHIFRLHPGQDLKLEIDNYTKKNKIKASVIVSCVGALTKATIRMAGARKMNTYEEDFEIVSLVGTAEKGYSHLHIAFSSEEGETIGGHLKSPSIVGTTAEVVLGEIEDVSFERVFDKDTDCKELVIKRE